MAHIARVIRLQYRVDVMLTGRDNDSGTRLGTFFETGFGTTATGGVDTYAFQYKFLVGATDAGTLASPAINGYTAFDLGTGKAGYASGGSVKNVLTGTATGNSPNAHPYIILGYVGTGDTPGAAQQLTYNGAAISNNAVQNAAYTFWTYEHMYYKPGSPKATIADAIALSIKNTYAASSGVLQGTMNCSRASEGTVVNPL